MSELPKTKLNLEELKTIFPHRYQQPQIDPSVFIAPGSHVIGDVTIGRRVVFGLIVFFAEM